MVYIFIFLLGLAVGSFLNCLIYRLEKNESFVGGRSYCPHCKHALQWIDLIPLISFFFLGGRCRYCHEKISVQYPIVEIATAVIFLLIFNIFPPISHMAEVINLIFLFYIASSLIVILVYDLKFYLIPDKVLFPAIIITLLYRLLLAGEGGIWNYILAALAASGFFLFLFLLSRGEWMGFGDVKLAILLGLLLGFPNILVGLFLAFLFGAIIGLGLLFLKKKGLKSEIPFAPFLIIGTFLAMFFGIQLIQWYSNFLLL